MVQERILTRPIVEGQCLLNLVLVKLCQTVGIISKCYRCLLSVSALVSGASLDRYSPAVQW